MHSPAFIHYEIDFLSVEQAEAARRALEGVGFTIEPAAAGAEAILYVCTAEDDDVARRLEEAIDGLTFDPVISWHRSKPTGLL